MLSASTPRKSRRLSSAVDSEIESPVLKVKESIPKRGRNTISTVETENHENLESDNQNRKSPRLMKSSSTGFEGSFDDIAKTPTKSSIRESIDKTPIKTDLSYLSVSDKCMDDPFTIAKRAFHRSGSFKIVGRVEEKAELTSFWYDQIFGEQGASIYISGNPGTGKTALLDELLVELSGGVSVVLIVKINCMMLKDPLRAFQEIVNTLNATLSKSEMICVNDKNPFIILDALESYFCSPKDRKRMTAVVIDEVDQIGMKDPELMCRLLALPYLPGAKVVVFGIANSMDLTERFLPRLKLLNCEPKVLHFCQYSVSDITAILMDRLKGINAAVDRGNGGIFIDNSAIELTARKVASTGDLRRALDTLRQAIDLAEDEYKLSGSNLLSSSSSSSSALVKLSHVVKILDKFGSSQSGPLVLLKSLNLHQKVILAAIIGFTNHNNNNNNYNHNNNNNLTVQKLYEEYCAAAERPPKLYESVTRSEFIDLILNLESMSLLGKSTKDSSPSSMDVWKLKVFLLVPNELVKEMMSQELPTIKILFGIK